MATDTTIEQPSVDIQRMVSDLMEQEPEIVTVRGKKRRITWLKRRTTRKFSHIMLKEEDPWKRNVKCCACVLMNSRHGLLTAFRLRFCYWLYWRWLYYVRDIDMIDVLGVLDASKKKIQSETLLLATILATATADTIMMMARHEYGQVGQAGEPPSL